MNSSELTRIGFIEITAAKSREINGGYCGDLLSWVMGRAEEGNLWFTIMGNLNAVAVASLVDVAAIVLCDGVTLEETVLQKAKEEGINIYATELPVYAAATRFFGYISSLEGEN